METNICTAVAALSQQKVIAYPTEAVFGVGCDPDSETAVLRLLALKQRPVEKGLILIAADYQQLLPYIDEAKIPADRLAEVHASWPGPFTWVMPARTSVPRWLTGEHESIAVRVSAHPIVQELCQAYGKPITSTSANLTGLAPCRTTEEVKAQLGEQLGAIVDATIGEQANPTQIRDAITGKVFRAS